MRPIKLKMMAFGPYKKEAEIDFEKLGKEGLYLITGDTGSGKTTIFDALTFALYGKASGDLRESDMLRSKYADPKSDTRVELDFEYFGKKYHVERSPSYERQSKRGTGTAKSNVKADLYHDGTLIATGDKAVTEKISELFGGITYKQYKQVAMIAQGDFRKLLTAESKERMEIYRNIFNTGLYDLITKKLKDENFNIAEHQKDLQSMFDHNKKILSTDNPEFTEPLKLAKAAKSEDLPAEEIIRLAEKIVEYDKNLIIQTQAEQDRTETLITEKNRAVEKAEKALDLSNKIKENEAEADIQKKNEQKSREDLERAKSREPEIEALDEKISVERSRLSEYDKLESEIKALRELQTEMAGADEELKKINARTLENQTSLENTNTQLLSLENAEVQRQKADTDLSKTREDHKKAEELCEKSSRRYRMIGDLFDKQRDYKSAQKKAIDKKRDHIEAYLGLKDQKERECEDLRKKIDEAEAAVKEIDTETEKLEQSENNVESLEKECDELRKEYKEINDFYEKDIKKLIDTENVLTEKRKRFVFAQDTKDRTEKEFQEAEKLRNFSMAGILAECLAEDSPCPVCGSTHHPKLAAKPLNAPTESEFDEIVKKREAANADYQNAATQAAECRSEFNAKKEALFANAERLLGESIPRETAFSELKSMAENRCGKIVENGKRVRELLKKANKDIESKNKLKAKRERLSAEYDAAKKKYDDLKIKIAQMNLTAEKLNEEFFNYVKVRCRELCERSGIEESDMFDREYCPAAIPSGGMLFDQNLTDRRLMLSKEAEADAEQASKTAEESKRGLEQLENILREECRRHFGSDMPLERFAELINKEKTQLESSLSQAERKAREANAACERKTELTKKRADLENTIKELEPKKNELSTRKTQLEVKSEQTKKSCEERRRGLEFESRSAAENNIRSMINSRNDLKKAITSADELHRKAADELKELRVKRELLEKQMQEYHSYETVDIEAERDEITKLKNQKDQLSEKRDILNARSTRNKDALKAMKKKSEEIEAVEKQKIMVENLYKTASGQLLKNDGDNGKKVKFEEFIQMYYFDKILGRANKRLYQMSRGQYELVRRKKSNKGLDLDISDLYNSDESKRFRDVRSLSGGESFLASLSLALGLSDEIMASKGGVRLETMFVDEGFGSLDDDTLNKAVTALRTLSDSKILVGIISHVAQLKESIDKQIIVTKKRDEGSEIRIEV